MRKNAFTVIELIIVITITSIIIGATFFSLSSFLTKTGLDSAKKEIIRLARRAHDNAVFRFNDKKWGLYFDDSAGIITLFAGDNFAGHDAQFDNVYELPQSIEIASVALTGGGKEIVFRKTDGFTAQNGDILLRDKRPVSITITINQWGQINFQ